MAAEKGDLLLIKILIFYGINIQSQDQCEDTPLHYAAANGHLEAVQYLIDAGADQKIHDDFSRLPLHLAIRNHQITVTQFLLWDPKIFSSKDRLDTLYLSLETQNEDLIAITNTALAFSFKETDEKGNNLLHYAARQNDFPLFKYFLETYQLNLEARNDEGYTPFLLASCTQGVDLLSYIMDKHPEIKNEFRCGKENALTWIPYSTHRTQYDQLLDTLSSDRTLYLTIINEAIRSEMSNFSLDLNLIKIRNLIEKGGTSCYFIYSQSSILTSSIQYSNLNRWAQEEDEPSLPLPEFILNKITKNTPHRQEILDEALYYAISTHGTSSSLFNRLLQMGADPYKTNATRIKEISLNRRLSAGLNSIDLLLKKLLKSPYSLFSDYLEILIAHGKFNLSLFEEESFKNMLTSFSSNDLTSALRPLLISCRDNRIQTMAQMQEKWVCVEFSASLFALTVLLCDGFFRCPDPSLIASDFSSRSLRFFRIAGSLPMDLQMVLCNRVYSKNSKEIISTSSTERAFRDWTLFME